MTKRLEYVLTVDDLVAKLNRFVGQSPVGRNFTWFAYFAIVGLAWLSAILFYAKQGHQNYGYLYSGGFALLLTLTLPRLYRWYQSSFWASVFTQAAVQGLVGRKTLTIGEDYLEEAGEKIAFRIQWRDVSRVEQDAHLTWLIIAPLIAIAIPAAAFPSLEAREAFTKACENRVALHAKATGLVVQTGAENSSLNE